jgi:hypothetical protein
MINPVIVQYNIPRYILGVPGKQHRTCTGDMNITPGMTEIFDFEYVNTDGVPINLVGFTLRLMFWFDSSQYESLSFNMESNIVLAKDIIIESPYKGLATVSLSDQETLTLGSCGKSSLRWSIFIINDLAQVFPTQITSDGRRYGILRIDKSDLPISETVLSTTLSPSFPLSMLSAAVVLSGVQVTSGVGMFTPVVF